MKSTLATAGTLVALVGGTGGAIAVGSSNNGSIRASAASGQYCPPDQEGAAFNEGFNHGFNGGWNEGFNPGFNNGFNNGWLRGFDVGFHSARDLAAATQSGPPYPGCDAFFQDGFMTGWDGGWHSGFNRGFHPGWHRGFNSGFNAGWRARHRR